MSSPPLRHVSGPRREPCSSAGNTSTAGSLDETHKNDDDAELAAGRSRFLRNTRTQTHVRGSTRALASSESGTVARRRAGSPTVKNNASSPTWPRPVVCYMLCVSAPGCSVAEWRKLRASAGGEKAEHLDKSATTSTTSPILANARLRRGRESSERERERQA